jgi:hypothetical protein
MNGKRSTGYVGSGWRLVIGGLLALAVTPTFSFVSAQNLYEPVTLKEDFQGDSLGQFASYPPPQDYGYEPSITPTDEFGAPGGRSLMRVVRPNRPGTLRFGFIRQTFLQTDTNGKISIAYYLNKAGPSAGIELGLAGGDGCPYLKRVAARAGSWVKVEVAVGDFVCRDGKAPGIGTAIEAFYVVADLDTADPDTTYHFLIDDLALQARELAHFDVRQPQTVRIGSQNAFVSARSFDANDSIFVSTAVPARMKNVEARIEDQDGNVVATQPLFDDGTRGDDRRGDGIWTNNAVYVLRAADPAGVWKIKLRGATEKGEKTETDVRFVHRSPRSFEHPRLYFDLTEKEALVARTRNPKLAPLWQKILAEAESRRAGDIEHAGEVFELLDDRYLLPSLLGYFDAMNQARLRIEYNSLVAFVTGDPRARESAKKAILDVSRWSRWEPPWFTAHGQHTYYPAGQLAAEVAFGYDLLYGDMTETERSTVRRALIQKSIVPVYKEYVLDDRVPANTSNWIGHTVGGALIAASAIAGDVKDAESNGQFDVFLNGLLLKLEGHIAASYLRDGSYGEGISYQEFDLETTAPALTALDRVFGVDYWDRTHIKSSTLYSLYTFARPTEASPDMGDTHPASGRTLAPLVKQTKNPTDRWFYEQFPHNSVIDFIFFDDSVGPLPPKLPTSRIFYEKGNAVFRTGWESDSTVFLFRAGPNFNHNHADEGSFLLSAFGEPLITEAGWSDYYKDPYYTTFFTQAIGHNTVLVAGDPESQAWPDTKQFGALNSFPRITDSVTSEFFDGVGSDLLPVYKGRLTRYTRRIAFLKPHYFVVFDDLQARNDTARFDFLLHVPDRTGLSAESGSYTYNGKRASLGIRVLAPEGAQIQVRDGRIPYHIFSARTPSVTPPQPGILDIESRSGGRQTQFVVALVPSLSGASARANVEKMLPLSGSNWRGLEAQRGAESDLVIFRANGGLAEMNHLGWSTDAATLAVTRAGTVVKMFALQEGRFLKQQDRVLFSANTPISTAVRYTSETVEAVCNANAATMITLFTGRDPVRISVDNKELPKGAFRFDPSNMTVSLNIPTGQHVVGLQVK